ncbi:beta-galactosidase [Candidatus Sumerlaeota bacterium]|nr:beta-galactosidase [Candidatus Sumerlaeota bacterium]
MNMDNEKTTLIYTFDASRLDRQLKPSQLAGGARKSPDGAEFWLNSFCYTRNGKSWLPVMGEFHFSRYPNAEWEQELLKMKAGGIDIVATYIFWIHHEEEEGKWDWTGDKDLWRFIELCQKHGLYVWLRIGPWCHGECRNGGLPDWLYAKCKPRTNEPVYLDYARKFMEQEFQQAKGLLLKDGGPVIGVQIDNEYYGGAEHLSALKKLARNAGFDAPFYSATAWGNASLPKNEMIPMYGAYTDAPWESGFHPLPPSGQYLFPSRMDDSDYASAMPSRQPDGLDKGLWLPSGYPASTCEVGGGNQITIRRRPLFTDADIAALAYVMIGKGVNLLGYYMYHGGTHPWGKNTSMHEQSCPVLSYDFEAPLGEYGVAREWYYSLRALHMFLRDYGESLAPAFPVLPPIQPHDPSDTNVLRCIARVDGNRAFVFFNNHQRGAKDREIGPLQFETKFKGEAIVFPGKPVTIEKGALGIFPVNLSLDGALLKYASAQPVCRLDTPDGPCHVFSQTRGIEPEFAFDAKTVRSVETSHGVVVERDGGIVVSGLRPGTDCFMKVTTGEGGKLTFLVLTHQQALQCCKADVWGASRLLLSECMMVWHDNALEITRIGDEIMSFSAFPAPDGKLSCNGGELAQSPDGVMTHYSIILPRKSVALVLRKLQVDSREAKALMAPQEKLKDDTFRAEEAVEITLPPDAFDGIHDLYLNIRLAGDVVRIWQDKKLIADDFWHGHDWVVGLGRFRPVETLTLAVSPLKKDAKIYIPPEVLPEFESDNLCRIDRIEAIPEYKICVRY